MTTPPIVRIFGIPMDLGQNRRGVDMGPSAIRYAGLFDRLKALGYDPYDVGNIVVPQAEQITNPTQGSIHYLPQVAQVCRDIYEKIMTCLQPDEFGIFLGGDHSISIGTLSAIAQQETVGVLWVDAHGDINTPDTSPSGNIHGMVLAALLGEGMPELTEIGSSEPKVQAQNVAMIGVRDLDAGERVRLTKSGILVHTMRQVDEFGMSVVAENVLQRFAHLDHIHVSLDLDSCDPTIAPGVGTPVNGGLSYREAHLLMEILADSGKVRTLDIVEVNPILDHHNRTAEMAVELTASLFGQRII